MRTLQASIVALLVVALGSSSLADDVDVYDVKFEEVANNCTQMGMAMAPGKLRIRKDKKGLVVELERVPAMSGRASKGGSVRATSPANSRTSIENVDGKFSVAGRVDDATLQLVFVAEYYAKRAALCTQSWNITGTREGAPAAKSIVERSPVAL